jgi:hypothetical protein
MNRTGPVWLGSGWSPRQVEMGFALGYLVSVGALFRYICRDRRGDFSELLGGVVKVCSIQLHASSWSLGFERLGGQGVDSMGEIRVLGA